MEIKAVSRSSKGLGKAVYARLLPKADLMETIKEICTQHGITNGVILCCMGSLSSVAFEFAKGRKRSGGDLKVSGSFLLHACQGIICPNDPEGDLSIHLHGSVRDSEGHIYQGHFAQHGNIIAATADIVISDLGVELIRTRDPELGVDITTLKNP